MRRGYPCSSYALRVSSETATSAAAKRAVTLSRPRARARRGAEVVRDVEVRDHRHARESPGDPRERVRGRERVRVQDVGAFAPQESCEPHTPSTRYVRPTSTKSHREALRRGPAPRTARPPATRTRRRRRDRARRARAAARRAGRPRSRRRSRGGRSSRPADGDQLGRLVDSVGRDHDPLRRQRVHRRRARDEPRRTAQERQSPAEPEHVEPLERAVPCRLHPSLPVDRRRARTPRAAVARTRPRRTRARGTGSPAVARRSARGVETTSTPSGFSTRLASATNRSGWGRCSITSNATTASNSRRRARARCRSPTANSTFPRRTARARSRPPPRSRRRRARCVRTRRGTRCRSPRRNPHRVRRLPTQCGRANSYRFRCSATIPGSVSSGTIRSGWLNDAHNSKVSFDRLAGALRRMSSGGRSSSRSRPPS